MSLKEPLTFLSFAILLIVLCLQVPISDAVTGPEHGKVVVCYVASWSKHRLFRGSFVIEDIDPTLCTHIAYTYVGLSFTHDGIISLDPWQTEDYGENSFQRVVGLKQNHPHLKVTISVGGWVQGSANFSAMAFNPEKRKKFVANSVEFLRKHNFDGLDLHWEFPGERGGAPIDKTKFLFLVKELRVAFDKHNLLLTSVFGPGRTTIDTAYEVQELSNYLDYIHLKTYDYHGFWDPTTAANAPLRSSDELNVEFTVNYLIQLGASPSKLILGLSLSGRTFILENETTETNVTLGSLTKEMGFQGQFSNEDGFMGYNEICSELQNVTAGYKTYWDEASETPLAVSGDKLISYDNDRSLLEKIKFAIKQNLGGVMAWSIDTDDFKGDCGMETYPLLRSINKHITETLENITKATNVFYMQEMDLYSCQVNVTQVCQL